MQTLPSNRKQKGFSLIELLATVAIIALLATVAMPFVETTVRREKEQELRSALREIRLAIDAYKQACATGHIAVSADKNPYPPNLEALVEGVEDIAKESGGKLYFLRRIPRDPFANDASISAQATWGLRSYQSPPDHPEKGEDVFDIYSLSPAIGLNGIPYAEW